VKSASKSERPCVCLRVLSCLSARTYASRVTHLSCELHISGFSQAPTGRVLNSYCACCRSDERGLSRKHIIESVKASLARLQLEFIDVVIIHKADPMCPMEGMYFTQLNFSHSITRKDLHTPESVKSTTLHALDVDLAWI
jgi:hypothetical protein